MCCNSCTKPRTDEGELAVHQRDLEIQNTTENEQCFCLPTPWVCENIPRCISTPFAICILQFPQLCYYLRLCIHASLSLIQGCIPMNSERCRSNFQKRSIRWFNNQSQLLCKYFVIYHDISMLCLLIGIPSLPLPQKTPEQLN